jgi:hypothetical protein
LSFKQPLGTHIFDARTCIRLHHLGKTQLSAQCRHPYWHLLPILSWIPHGHSAFLEAMSQPSPTSQPACLQVCSTTFCQKPLASHEHCTPLLWGADSLHTEYFATDSRTLPQLQVLNPWAEAWKSLWFHNVVTTTL